MINWIFVVLLGLGFYPTYPEESEKFLIIMIVSAIMYIASNKTFLDKKNFSLFCWGTLVGSIALTLVRNF
jgi:hypothetical protein